MQNILDSLKQSNHVNTHVKEITGRKRLPVAQTHNEISMYIVFAWQSSVLCHAEQEGKNEVTFTKEWNAKTVFPV